MEEIKRFRKTLWSKKERLVRRAPLQLLTDYIRLLSFFSQLDDHEVGRPFFHAQWKKQARTSLKYVARGWLSDPLGMPMYIAIPNSGRSGLSEYHCLRGSSGLRGVASSLSPAIPRERIVDAGDKSRHGGESFHTSNKC